jgi:PAS domain S-box-containing protein
VFSECRRGRAADPLATRPIIPIASGDSTRPPVPGPRASAFARLLEDVHEGVYIGAIDPARPDAGATIAANAYLRKIFGFADDAPEQDLAVFAGARFADAPARQEFLDRLVTDGAVTDYLLRMRRADGTAVWVEVTARAIAEAGAVHVEALIRDVSERKKLDDRSRDLYLQLLQAEKMAALGQTISGVAHELNNPLATILNWAERLSERALDDTARRGVDIILGEAERAARIVRQLLTFARKRQSTRSLIHLNEVIQETLALRAYEHRVTNISVVTTLAKGLPQVFADAHQIQQVLLNLVINAEQAMLAAHGRGTLTVRTRWIRNATWWRSRWTTTAPEFRPACRPRYSTRSIRPRKSARAPGSG